MLSVVTITLNPSVDNTIAVDRLVPEEKLRGQVLEIEPGGGGVQVARALRRLGASVEAVVTIGGSTGQSLLSLLEAEGLNVRPVWVESTTRPSITLKVLDQGTNYRIVGSAEPLAEHEYLPVLSRLREIEQLPPYVVLSGSFPPGVPPTFVHDIAQVTVERGSQLLVDSSGDALRAAVHETIAVLKPSQEELAAIVGDDPDDPDCDVSAAAHRVVGDGVGAVVVSLGKGGCYVLSATGEEAYLDAPQVTVASTVAAGDSMVAGLVAGLSRGLRIVESARLGVACGTATCLHPGSGIFTQEDVAQVLPRVRVHRVDRASGGPAGTGTSPVTSPPT